MIFLYYTTLILIYNVISSFRLYCIKKVKILWGLGPGGWGLGPGYGAGGRKNQRPINLGVQFETDNLDLNKVGFAK